MSMIFTESSHTYAQFMNLIFESLSTMNEKSTQSIIIKHSEKTTMISFVNDYFEVEMIFEFLFKFFHHYYFFKMTFKFVYFNSKKTIIFIKELNMINFIKKSNEIRSSIKHWIKIMKWFIFINKIELNEFLWFTSFLRQFIFNKVDHMLIMKKIYMIQMLTKSIQMKFKAKMKKCDENLIKILKKKKTITTNIIKR
jgi:hypothetical protein